MIGLGCEAWLARAGEAIAEVPEPAAALRAERHL